MELRRRRAYDTASPEDGCRVLIDRLWPRGVSKQNAAIDLWAKDIAPTAELRHDWHESPDDFEANAERYRAQLKNESADALAELVEQVKKHPVVTLVYGLRDTEHNHAVVLQEVLEEIISP